MATKRNDLRGFNSGKSLNESINDVMNEKSSRVTKRNKLVKLGLHAGDIEYIFSQYHVTVERKGKFDFSKLTFGVEIECYNFVRSTLVQAGNENGLQVVSEGYNHIDNNRYFKIVSDGSLTGENSNEVVSPILKGKKGLSSLESLCKSLEAVDARVNRSCGLHVHIGAADMSDEHYVRIARNYQKLEGAIDTFMPVSRRANNNGYCMSLAGVDLHNCRTKQDVRSAFNYDRYYKFNAEAYARHKTVEFRQHSGTTDYNKISHWVMFLAKLVEYSYTKELSCNISLIEDIPFLSESEKEFFISRRAALQ